MIAIYGDFTFSAYRAPSRSQVTASLETLTMHLAEGMLRFNKVDAYSQRDRVITSYDLARLRGA